MNRRTVLTLLAAIPAQAVASTIMNTTDTFVESDATLVVDGIRIPGRLTRPAETAHPTAAVVILPGSLYSDVDGDYPFMNARPHTYRDLAHQLAARGVASIRQAKIGPGTGSQTLDANEAAKHRRFTNRVHVASVALDHLRNAVPNARLCVAGHSEGAIIAGLLAAQEDVAGLISLSGPALRLFDIMRGQLAAMQPPGAPVDLSVFDHAVAEARAGRSLPPEAARHPQTAMLVSMGPEALAFMRDIDAVDPLAVIANVRQPALIVQGGRDPSVSPEQADALIAARKALPTKAARFPELQHCYKRAAPNMNPMESFGLSTECDPAVADAITAWIKQI